MNPEPDSEPANSMEEIAAGTACERETDSLPAEELNSDTTLQPEQGIEDELLKEAPDQNREFEAEADEVNNDSNIEM